MALDIVAVVAVEDLVSIAATQQMQMVGTDEVSTVMMMWFFFGLTFVCLICCGLPWKIWTRDCWTSARLSFLMEWCLSLHRNSILMHVHKAAVHRGNHSFHEIRHKKVGVLERRQNQPPHKL